LLRVTFLRQPSTRHWQRFAHLNTAELRQIASEFTKLASLSETQARGTDQNHFTSAKTSTAINLAAVETKVPWTTDCNLCPAHCSTFNLVFQLQPCHLLPRTACAQSRFATAAAPLSLRCLCEEAPERLPAAFRCVRRGFGVTESAAVRLLRAQTRMR